MSIQKFQQGVMVMGSPRDANWQTPVGGKLCWAKGIGSSSDYKETEGETSSLKNGVRDTITNG